MSDIHYARMDKTVFAVSELTDEPDEIAYWRSQTPAVRLQAVELLRQVMYGTDQTSARLQRVLTVVEFPAS